MASWNNILAFFADSYDRIKVLGVIVDSGFYGKQFIETLEKEQLAYIIAVRLIRPLPSGNRSPKDWQCRDSPSYIPSGKGKTLSLFAHEIDIKDYRFSAWITNSHEPVYAVQTPGKR